MKVYCVYADAEGGMFSKDFLYKIFSSKDKAINYVKDNDFNINKIQEWEVE